MYILEDILNIFNKVCEKFEIVVAWYQTAS